MMIEVHRITDYVRVIPHGGGPGLELCRDEPGVADHGRRNPPGYVTLSFFGDARFFVSDLRRALDEYERTCES